MLLPLPLSFLARRFGPIVEGFSEHDDMASVIKRERREGAIEQLMNDANKQGEKTKVEVTPVEVAPAE